MASTFSPNRPLSSTESKLDIYKRSKLQRTINFHFLILCFQGEGDTSRATDPESALSPKKKKKGLRTPSFLKKKKKDKKEKDEKKKEKTPA